MSITEMQRPTQQVKQAMIDVKRLGHATFSTPDLGRQVEYWTEVMGLVCVYQDAQRAVLATRLGQESVVLEAGDRADVKRIAFQASVDTDLADIATTLRRAGIASERRSCLTPGIADAITFLDPRGTVMEIFTHAEFHPFDRSEHGIAPLKIGHVACRVTDVRKMADFYAEVMGFRASDWIGDHFAFMRCGPEHHSVNFARYEKEGLHHVAFEVKDWSAMQRSCEVLANNQIQLVWGPLRHIVGHNVAAYHRNSDDLRIECYCEMDFMPDEGLGYWAPRPWHEELPLKPKVWPANTWRSAWGFGSFGTFPGYP